MNPVTDSPHEDLGLPAGDSVANGSTTEGTRMSIDLTALPAPVLPGQQQDWLDKRLPVMDEVRTGLWSVSIPFQDNPMRLTYCYLLTGPDGTLVVDPGWDSEEGWQVFLDAMAEQGLDPADITGILVTHFHPDHLAMAHRVADRTGAWIGLHPADQAVVSTLADRQRFDRREADWLQWAGVPEEQMAAFAGRHRRLDGAWMTWGDYRGLTDGESFATAAGPARVLHTPGHTPGHVCLVLDDAELLLSGDHILPKISPTMAFGVDRGGDPLADYLRSLQSCADLGDLEVAPAHEYRFRGLPDRAGALIDEHHRRSAEVRSAIESGAATLHEIATRISWRRRWEEMDLVNRFIAMSETECYAAHLARSGRVDWRPYEQPEG